MKSVLSFISFICAVTLAGIGIESQINLAILAGLFFTVLTVVFVFLDARPLKN